MQEMDAGYVVGDGSIDRIPLMVASYQVGAPLASIRAEAASLLQHLSLVAIYAIVGVYWLPGWQPDWVTISHVHKRSAIIDLCHPLDVHREQLHVAATRKQERYSPLIDDLEHCTCVPKGKSDLQCNTPSTFTPL